MLKVNDCYKLPPYYTKKINESSLRKLLKKKTPENILKIIRKRHSFVNNIKRLSSINRIADLENQIQDLKNFIQKEAIDKSEIQYRDLILMLQDIKPFIKENNHVALETDFPVAYDSLDHIYPEGTMIDNTRNLRFCKKCEEYFDRKISYLDLGCSGGGLVLDFLLNGHFAMGIEGSDYSAKAQRAEWRIIPKNLFTADITKPFNILDTKSKHTKLFEVISAWEVLEHLSNDDVERTFGLVSKHLHDDGIFTGSIGICPSYGAFSDENLHITTEKPQWWMNKFKECGFIPLENQPFEYSDFCRGSGNGYRDPNYRGSKYSNGFHFVVRKQK